MRPFNNPEVDQGSAKVASASTGYWAHQELTQKIIGAAHRVYKRMGAGFLESVYENCMIIELGKLDVEAKSQVPITVFYEGLVVGEFVADLLVAGVVIVELKAIRELQAIHEVQLVNYLQATGIPVGLLLNFGEKGVQAKRRVRTLESRKKDDDATCFLHPVHPVNPVEELPEESIR